MILQNWRRPFQSGLIIQCFSAYISATKHVPWLLGMYPLSEDPNVAQPEPRPALALATAAVERALTYVSEGRITLDTIEADRTKEGHLITADLNAITKRRAVSTIAFSEPLWGVDVSDYLASIRGLRKSDMESIIFQARKFARVTRTHVEEDEEEAFPTGPRSSRARIPLNYDDDDEGGECDESETGAGALEYNEGRNIEDDDEGFEDDQVYDAEDGHALEYGDDDDDMQVDQDVCISFNQFLLTANAVPSIQE